MNKLLKRLMKNSLWPIPAWAVFADDGGDDGGGGGDDAGADDKGDTGDNAGDKTILDTPISPVKPDGSLIDNWRELAPEEYKEIVGEKSLETVTDFWNGMKQLVNHKKMVGANTVKVPTDKSTDKEWAEFYSSIGRPATAGDYKIEIPEEMGEIFTKERLEVAKERAFKIGVSQKQFADYMTGEMEEVAAMIQAQEEAEQKARNDAELELKKEFGGAYDDYMHAGNRIITDYLPQEEDRLKFLEEFGNNPRFIRFAAIMGSRMNESKAQVAALEQKTPSGAQARIKELQATPGYYSLDDTMTQDERDRITAEIRELHKQIAETTARQAG